MDLLNGILDKIVKEPDNENLEAYMETSIHLLLTEMSKQKNAQQIAMALKDTLLLILQRECSMKELEPYIMSRINYYVQEEFLERTGFTANELAVMKKQSLAENMKLIRIKYYLSQTKMAKKCGICPSTLSDIESGLTKRVRYSTMKKIAHTLHMDVSEFMAIVCLQESCDKDSKETG